MRRQPPRPLRPGPAPHWGGPARGVSPGLPVQPALTAGSCVRGVAVPSGLHLWHRRPAGAPQENRQGGPPRGSPRHFLRDSTRLATSWRTGRGGPLGVVCLASLVDRARLPRPPAVLLLRLGALSSPAGGGGEGRGGGSSLKSAPSPTRLLAENIQVTPSSRVLPTRQKSAPWPAHRIQEGSVHMCQVGEPRGPPGAPSGAHGGGQRLRVWSPDAPRCVRNRAPPSHQ